MAAVRAEGGTVRFYRELGHALAAIGVIILVVFAYIGVGAALGGGCG